MNGMISDENSTEVEAEVVLGEGGLDLEKVDGVINPVYRERDAKC